MATILNVAMVRYPIGAVVPVEVYTAPMDPNDPIYQTMPLAPAEMKKYLGDNERTRLFHTVHALIRAVNGLDKRVKSLETKVIEPNEPAAADPNEVVK
jgi:hypothetical protein